MRMRRRNNLAPRMAACEPVWIHEPETLRGNWRSLKPDCTALWVEVGCGKGKFTAETAQANPDVLLIAVERCRVCKSFWLGLRGWMRLRALALILPSAPWRDTVPPDAACVCNKAARATLLPLARRAFPSHFPQERAS